MMVSPAAGMSASYDEELIDGGRLTIPSVGEDVAIYWSPLEEGHAQEVVDQKDSAAIWQDEDSGTLIICDHRSDGFEAIKFCKPGCIAYIKQTDGSLRKLKCIGIDHKGRNLGVILDGDKNRAAENGEDVMMYTCMQDRTHVCIVYWEFCDN